MVEINAPTVFLVYETTDREALAAAIVDYCDQPAIQAEAIYSGESERRLPVIKPATLDTATPWTFLDGQRAVSDRPMARARLDLNIAYSSPEAEIPGIDSLVRSAELLYHATDPVYGFGILRESLEAIGNEEFAARSPVSEAALKQGRIDYPTWLMLFPPAMVETYGREWLFDLPAFKIRHLNDGGLLVRATERLTDIADTLQRIGEIREAFGEHPEHPIPRD